MEHSITGLLRCSRFAFGPNRLHYCGPDQNQELLAHIEHDAGDAGLAGIMQRFETMYPYLSLIARANRIQDPFDERVVEAYWIGNQLLSTVSKSDLYEFLLRDLSVKKKIGSESFHKLEEKIRQRAIPHHSFHVFNVWRQASSKDETHTLENMDECRVNTGKVLSVSGPWIEIETEPLIRIGNHLALGTPRTRKLVRGLEAELDVDLIKPGQIIAFHWGVPCEVVSEQQALHIRQATLQSIAFVNQNL